MGAETSSLESIQELRKTTSFDEDELIAFYKEFKDDYPEGKVNMAEFKTLFTKFFPLGDAEKYSEHVYRSFDGNRDGAIDFKEFVIGLSILTRGDLERKMRWAFDLYDLDGNGFISITEAEEIINTVYKMMSSIVKIRKSSTCVAVEMFEKYDTNQDGRLSFDEFVQGNRKDSTFVKLLQCEPGTV
ncbi:neuron-specific calcium-binding protein hippocalcin-like [Lineus longissimus]|uniref:neuron-specific calcium-binding protein hippocalcin-like n=1 Tax=Lineus longissimus TaxID=88925 RepID=UPI00315CC8D4